MSLKTKINQLAYTQRKVIAAKNFATEPKLKGYLERKQAQLRNRIGTLQAEEKLAERD